jgi:hypothetical protein
MDSYGFLREPSQFTVSSIYIGLQLLPLASNTIHFIPSFPRSHVLMRLNLPIEACDDGSKGDMLATPLTCPNTPTHSNIPTKASRLRTKVGWKPEDDTRLVDIRKGGC